MTRGKILVTGANGFLGSAMVARLLAEGTQVRAAVRSAAANCSAGCEKIVVGDLAASTDWAEAVSGIDCVIHIAGRAHVLNEQSSDPLAEFRAVNRDATLGLARAAEAAKVRRLVFVSSIGVNGGETFGVPFRVSDAAAPHSDYAVAKWEAEQQLTEFAKAAKLEVVIVRPPLILGRDAKGNLATLMRAIDKGVPMPLGSVRKNRRDFVSLDNLVDLLCVTVDHPEAAGRTFLASDGAPVSTRGLIEYLGGLRGGKARLLPFPPALLGWALRLVGRKQLASQLLGDLEVDIGETRALLGWQPKSIGVKEL